MRPPVTWRTDDPCPVCATGLHATMTGPQAVRQNCPVCGWSTTWATWITEGGRP